MVKWKLTYGYSLVSREITMSNHRKKSLEGLSRYFGYIKTINVFG